MARVKNSVTTKARHKKVLKQAKGYFGSKHRLYKSAKEQLMHSGQYAFRDRKQKKRDFRKLWITRINAACREEGISYSRFIEGLTKAGVSINRKMLSEIAINDKERFKDLVQLAKDGKDGKVKPTQTEIKTEVTIKSQAKEAPKKEEKKQEEQEKTTDYSKMTVAELREIAKNKNIKGASTMKKSEILEALK